MAGLDPGASYLGQDEPSATWAKTSIFKWYMPKTDSFNGIYLNVGSFNGMNPILPLNNNIRNKSARISF
jgi:hypothetical protein